METKNIVNNVELKNIIDIRIPPYLWDLIGYGGGLVAIFYYNKIGIILYSCTFVLYNILNIIFDCFSVSFDYSNNIMPKYKDIENQYDICITNKKYILQNINNVKPFEQISMIDDSKLKIELSIYVGENNFIKNMLYFIYLLGITKKNYTLNDYNDFKDTTIYFY
jgi:hypothetical protein